MCDIEKIDLLLNLIISYRAETYAEAIILANLAFSKSRQILKNTEKMGLILDK